MKVVILAGGLGTRISEESHLKPKPMIEIGEQPILWHIMKYYSSFGFYDFIICCGYKGHIIKEYFADYYLYRSDVTFDFSAENRMTVHENIAEPWRVTLVDTGLNTQTGGRIKRVQKYIGDETFLLTYGDGVSNVDLKALLEQHRVTGKVVTLTGIQPGGRFGVLDLDETGQTVNGFREKAKEDGGWINGGFMVMEPEVFGYLSAQEGCILERTPLETLAREGKLGIYKHGGFWQCMDTQRDKGALEWLWSSGSTDESGKIADTYAVGDSRIRVIHRQRGNIGAGRNTALDAARGEYLTFIDDDDWAEPDFLEFLVNLLEENSADVAICGAADKVFNEKKIMTAEEALIELMWRKKYNMAFPTKLFRREVAETLRFPADGAYDDIALMYKLLAGAKRVAYHGLPKYTFYRHEGNNSAWTTNHALLNAATLDEYLYAYRTRTEWLSELFPDSAPAWRYFEWSFMISMVEKITRLNIPDCEGHLEAMKKELSAHRQEFLNASETLDFEKMWMEEYVQ